MLDLLNHSMLRIIFVATLNVFIAACGGSDSPSGGGNNIGGGGGTGGGGGGGGGSATVPTAEVSPEGSLSPKQSVTITFSEAMDTESVSLSGSLAEMADTEWSEDNTTLSLAPQSFWQPGSQTLTIDANDAEGDALETLEASFEVNAPFNTFQEASLVIGQPDFASEQSRQGGTTAHANTLDGPLGSVAFASGQNVLFVPDSHDSRVLGFTGVPDMNNANASFVIGQPDFSSTSGEVSAEGMRQPQAVTTEGGNLVVTDAWSNRVLIYDGIPETGPAAASIVVGQESMDTDRSGCAADMLHANHVHGHFVSAGGKLIVADSGNNRVLIWNEMPTSNAQPADLVLGQADFTSCVVNAGGSPTAATLRHPTNVWTDDERLFVADQENNRILVWNTFPTENFAEADYVIGQSSMTNVAMNDDDQDGVDDGVASARTLHFPWDVQVANGMMFVTDMENNRVLVWNEVPTESFVAADVVLGQQDFAGNSEDAGDVPGASTLDRPAGVEVINDQLYVTDWENSRVLVFDVQE